MDFNTISSIWGVGGDWSIRALECLFANLCNCVKTAIFWLFCLIWHRWDAEVTQKHEQVQQISLRKIHGSRRIIRAQMLGWFLFRKVWNFKLCMFPSCSHWFTDFRTIFVFALGPFLPMVVVFFRLQWEFQWENGQNKKMAKNHFSRSDLGS